jgi:hypothetical protein
MKNRGIVGIRSGEPVITRAVAPKQSNRSAVTSQRGRE